MGFSLVLGESLEDSCRIKCLMIVKHVRLSAVAFIDVATVDVSAVVLGLAWKPRVVVIVLIVQQQ